VKIGIINTFDKVGGRRTFIDEFSDVLKKKGYTVKVVDLNMVSVGELNNFDILHFSDHYLRMNAWKLLLVNHPKKILTVHGWVKKETVHELKHGRPDFRTVAGGLLSLAIWNVVPLLFDIITCPSKRTAEENGLKNAIVMSNAISSKYCESVGEIDDARTKPIEILFVTYVSIGGLKNVGLTQTIRVVKKLNEILNNRKVALLVFGKDYYGRSRYPYVHFMGYSNEFLGILKSSDLFISGKSFPDLGYAEMEAGILGIPVAKFTEDYETEEIIDGQTGVLAKSEDEMVNKLLDYISDLKNNKQKLGNSFREYINKNKSWNGVIDQWNELFMNCLLKKKFTN